MQNQIFIFKIVFFFTLKLEIPADSLLKFQIKIFREIKKIYLKNYIFFRYYKMIFSFYDSLFKK